jgi:hypothetical protein
MGALVTPFNYETDLIDRADLLRRIDIVAKENPELVHNTRSVFFREGVPFELSALLNYLFVLTATPLDETKNLVVVVRERNSEERCAAVRALGRKASMPSIREIKSHADS